MLELVESAIDMLYYNGKMGEIATKHFGSDVTEGVRTVTEERRSTFRSSRPLRTAS